MMHQLTRPVTAPLPAPANRALGLDLGQVSDYTALAVVEWTEKADHHQYALRFLDRVPLGTSYPAIAKHVASLMTTAELKDRTRLVVDGTGAGRPVMDILREALPLTAQPMPVVVHGGRQYTVQSGWHHLPKRELVATAQALLQSRRLTFPRTLPLVKQLEEELLKFEVKITDAGSDTYGAWREGAHDDLVFALCLALWYGERASAEQLWARTPTTTVDRLTKPLPRPSLLGKPKLVRNDDGTYRVERAAS